MALPDDISMPELSSIRDAELRDAERNCADSFEAYWAGSASASVLRDYAAGRVSIHAGRTSRRSVR